MSTRETQRRIKAAALELFNARGTAAVSPNLIAEHCGISKGNLHYHFRNKPTLIRSIFADITAEIEPGWGRDDDEPTVIHMAAMFARQTDLVWRYRFIYREMVALARADPLLTQAIRDYRQRRIPAVVRFFRALVATGVLKRPRSAESLRQLVVMTWIFSDNWLNFVELQGELAEDPVQAGYDLILELLDPYLTTQAKEQIVASYDVIRHYPRIESPA